VENVREERRTGDLSPQANVTYYPETREVVVNSDRGRARRPLIVVEEGEAKLTDEIVEKVKVRGIRVE